MSDFLCRCLSTVNKSQNGCSPWLFGTHRSIWLRESALSTWIVQPGFPARYHHWRQKMPTHIWWNVVLSNLGSTNLFYPELNQFPRLSRRKLNAFCTFSKLSGIGWGITQIFEGFPSKWALQPRGLQILLLSSWFHSKGEGFYI